MKNLTKTYKFIYRQEVRRSVGDVAQYTFANRAPKGYEMINDVNSFFNRSVAGKEFLTGPANEANITRAFVKYFTYWVNRNRRNLTFINKKIVSNSRIDLLDFQSNKIRRNDTEGWVGFTPNYYSKQIKHYKKNLAIWTERYEKLKREGVYTYLELIGK